MAHSRAFVRYALLWLSCGFVWALCGCTGKVTGGEANAATADTAADAGVKSVSDAGPDRDAATHIDAGATKADAAGAGGARASSPTPESARDGGSPRAMEETKPASAPDHATPAQTPANAGELTCEPLFTPAVVTYPTCAPGICPAQDSVCVPGPEVQALGIPFATATALPECSDGSKCVASAIVEQAGHVRLQQCSSIAGAEGRCISSCMPVGSLRADELPQGSCKGADRCAPCYDPRDGRATGVCGLGCDRGPSEPPRTLAACCKGRGKCMPPPRTGERASLELSRDSCDADAVCMPSAIMDSTSIPKSCKSVDGAEGRCLSSCVGRVTSLPELPTKGCASDEVCAPCYDPITGKDTGACNLHGDAPKEPAHRFQRCCDSDREIPAGVCVPPSFTRVRQADIFRRNSCSRGTVCVPTIEIIDPNHQYPLCLGVGLGVCMPSCLFDPLDALLLNNLTCNRGEVCAPCSPLIGGCN